ncbi:MAG: NADH-quinone oxidoreductase subunit NuoK [Candidatus Sericytochromatia bacterium]|nr:NADH-quinone oxidoreductase subunit NuoK [Candidatus Sericytochromatia bacterium]
MSPIGLQDFLIVSAALFFTGVVGFLSRKNLFIVFMSIELMLNAVNLSFLAFSRGLGQVDGQVVVFMVVAVAAAEIAIGLSLVILLFKHRETLNVDAYQVMKG